MSKSKDPNYITPEGLKSLRDEYQKLFHVDRPETVKAVAWAASLGDRSENADYIYNKKKLREIDKRLEFLIKRIDAAHVVDPKENKGDKAKIVFGATVTISDEDGNKKTYKIAGEDEINISAGIISWRSPIAKALIGKKIGDEVTIKKPNGDAIIEVISVEYK
ncbi:MAG: transcription elongation factor GreB [Proteobacteria bacterium SG_bin7]|nr:MAG: transcription elongation factor GreB [Proteobacteria bacterium SG_bin7]